MICKRSLTVSRYALLAVIDVLASELAIAIGERALENVRRIKHHLGRLTAAKRGSKCAASTPKRPATLAGNRPC